VKNIILYAILPFACIALSADDCAQSQEKVLAVVRKFQAGLTADEKKFLLRMGPSCVIRWMWINKEALRHDAEFLDLVKDKVLSKRVIKNGVKVVYYDEYVFMLVCAGVSYLNDGKPFDLDECIKNGFAYHQEHLGRRK